MSPAGSDLTDEVRAVFALGVGKHHPRHLSLADVGEAGAPCEQALDHRLLLLAARGSSVMGAVRIG